jgi:sec-independent protein translocase protein TatB
MFDIGFWEILLIAVIALLVVGPERFPSMVRTAGYYFGKFRSMAMSVKDEIDREVSKAEQLQKLVDEQEEIIKRHEDILQSDAVNERPRPQPVSQSSPVSNPKTKTETQGGAEQKPEAISASKTADHPASHPASRPNEQG